MFFKSNNLDDSDYTNDNDKKKINLSSFKLPLIILGSILFLILIIFLVSKLINKERIAYDDKLYYINLLGGKEVILYLDEDYVEPGYTGTDDEGNNLTSQVVITNNINNSKIGSYKVSYTLGNITKERNVKVIEKPTGATYIYLYGDVNVFLYIGEEYQEKGYEVIDILEGSKLKDKVKINSNVDTSKEGIYKVIYSVTNTSGVTTSKERTVIVMDRNLSLIPDITYSTNKNITINIYAKDELFSYLILPNNNKVEKNMTTYEVSSNGTYKFVMYNNKGEKTEKQITINNIDRESPSGSCFGSYGNGVSQINISASDNIGISKYVINGTTYTTSSIKINGELASVNVTIYDKAGNTKTISCKLDDKRPASSSSKPSSSSSSSKSSSSSSSKSSSPSHSTVKPSSSSSSNVIIINGSITTTERTDYDSEMRYVEVLPEKVTANLPLVIYLDGAWSHNSFPNVVLDRSITKYVQSGNAYNEVGEYFIYISPRHVINNGVNGGLNWYGSDGPREGKKIVGLIEHLYKKYKIDKKRIYITGVSLGGDGAFYMVDAYPNLFAASVAVSGCPFSADPGNFVTTPLLGYNGTGNVEQRAGYTQCVPKMINRIKAAGGLAESRVKKGWNHADMFNVYSTDKDVFKWMFKYHR